MGHALSSTLRVWCWLEALCNLGIKIPETARFEVSKRVSLVVFGAILHLVARHRAARPRTPAMARIASVVVAGGMLFARFGNNAGLPRWIYYTLPALAALLLPPAAFAFPRRELALYPIMVFLSSPAIHVVFSFLSGWLQYMPLLRVPPLHRLIG